jgi:hypothetical protein
MGECYGGRGALDYSRTPLHAWRNGHCPNGRIPLSVSAPTRVQLCGRLLAEVNGRRVEDDIRGRQGRLLFAYLVVNRGRALSRDELIDAVWSFEPPARPDAALSTLLSNLRGALGRDAIEGRSELQLVLPAGAWVDLEAAAEAIAAAHPSKRASDSRSRPSVSWDIRLFPFDAVARRYGRDLYKTFTVIGDAVFPSLSWC